MRNYFLLCWSSDTHLHGMALKVHLNIAVVSLGRTDVESIGAGLGGVREGELG